MIAEIVVTTKTCTRCGEVKPLDAFVKEKGARDGRGPHCKACDSKRVLANQKAAEYATLRYDYQEIDAEHRQAVQDAALEIRGRQKRMMEDVLAIGRRLLEVRALMPDQFVEWAKEEFGYRRQWAYETINVYERLEDCPIIGQLSDTSARLIAGPGVPNEVIEAVVEETRRQGRTLLVSEVRAIKADRMPQKPPQKSVEKYSSQSDTIDADFTVMPSEDELAAIAIVEAERAEEDAERAARDDARATFERVPDAPSMADEARGIKVWLAEVRDDHPDLFVLVENVRVPLTHLIRALEKKEGSHAD